MSDCVMSLPSFYSMIRPLVSVIQIERKGRMLASGHTTSLVDLWWQHVDHGIYFMTESVGLPLVHTGVSILPPVCVSIPKKKNTWYSTTLDGHSRRCLLIPTPPLSLFFSQFAGSVSYLIKNPHKWDDAVTTFLRFSSRVWWRAHLGGRLLCWCFSLVDRHRRIKWHHLAGHTLSGWAVFFFNF